MDPTNAAILAAVMAVAVIVMFLFGNARIQRDAEIIAELEQSLQGAEVNERIWKSNAMAERSRADRAEREVEAVKLKLISAANYLQKEAE